MSALEVNKILASIIVAILVVAVISHLGDIIVSFPQAQKQSNLYQHSIEVEIATLVAHGTLHLLGFDHFEPNETILMKEKTLMILKNFNFDNKT